MTTLRQIPCWGGAEVGCMESVLEEVKKFFSEYGEEKMSEAMMDFLKKLVRKSVVSLIKANAPLTVHNLITEMQRHYIMGAVRVDDERLDRFLGLALGKYGMELDVLSSGKDNAISMLHKATDGLLGMAVDYLVELGKKVLEEEE